MSLKSFSLATGLLGTGILTLTGIVAGSAIKTTVDFQQQLISTGNNAGMTASQIADMGNTVMQMSAQMGASKENLMTAYMYIHDMGYAGQDAVDILTAATKEALATGASISDTASVLATAMHSFKIPVQDAASTIDMLHTAAASARMTMQDFMQSFGPVGAQAAAIGVPLNDAAAAMAALTRNGFDASMSATQVRDMLLHIMAPSKSAQGEIAALSGGMAGNAKAAGNMSLKQLEAAQKMQDLTAKVQIANERLTELQTGHKNTAITTATDTARISEYEAKIEETNAKIATENTRIAELSASHKTHASTIQAAQNRLQSYQDTIANYNDKIVQTKARMSALNDTTITHISTVDSAKLRITELNQQIQDQGIKAGLTKSQIAGLSKSGIDLAFDFSQAGLKAKGLSGVLADLKVVTGGNAEEMNKLIPNLRGGLGALVLVNNGHKDLIDILNKEKDSLGSTESAYALYSSTTTAQANKAKEGFENLQIAIGTALLPTVNSLLQALLPLIQQFAVFANQHPKVIAAIMGGAAALGIMLLAISAVTAILPALAVLFNPVTLAIGVFGGAVIGQVGIIIKNFQLLQAHWTEVSKDWQKLWSDAVSIINGAVKSIMGTLDNLAKKASDALSHLDPFAHHSPSLIEQVTSGVSTIKGLYQSLSGMNINSPNIGAPNMGGIAGAVGGGLGGMNPYALAAANNFSYQNVNTPTNNMNVSNTFNIKGDENAVGFAEYIGFQLEHMGIV